MNIHSNHSKTHFTSSLDTLWCCFLNISHQKQTLCLNTVGGGGDIFTSKNHLSNELILKMLINWCAYGETVHATYDSRVKNHSVHGLSLTVDLRSSVLSALGCKLK